MNPKQFFAGIVVFFTQPSEADIYRAADCLLDTLGNEGEWNEEYRQFSYEDDDVLIGAFQMKGVVHQYGSIPFRTIVISLKVNNAVVFSGNNDSCERPSATIIHRGAWVDGLMNKAWDIWNAERQAKQDKWRRDHAPLE